MRSNWRLGCLLVTATLIASCSETARLERKCEGDDPNACRELERSHREACEGRSMSACFELAHMFRPGKDVRWSSSEKEGEALAKAVAIDSLAAVDSQQTACEGGDASACYTLGRLLHGGLGVRESRSKAAEYYRRACDGGDAAGCYELGEMQLVGDGIAADRWTAEELLEHACQGGVATACSHLEALVIEME